MELVGWSDAGDGHCLEELEYCVVELLWHVFDEYTWDVVGAGCFVARQKAESFVENGGCEFAYDHVFGRGGCSRDCVYPGSPFGSILGSGERETISIFSTIAITSMGLFVVSLVSGSRSADRCWM